MLGKWGVGGGIGIEHANDMQITCKSPHSEKGRPVKSS